jgi:hypothetical protein
MAERYKNAENHSGDDTFISFSVHFSLIQNEPKD